MEITNIKGKTNAYSKVIKMATHRKTSLLAGILYLLTFVSIPTLTLYSSIHNPNYIFSGGSDNPIIFGGILEIIVALANIGTAVVLFPVLKKQQEMMALGLVAARILEAGTMFVGVAFILSLVTLHKAGVGANGLVASQTLMALYDRIFLLGQSFMPAVCDLLLGFMLYKSGLVPKALALIGIFGAPILLIGYFAVMFGFIDRTAPFAGLSALPVALFEFSLGIYLIVKGFKTSSSLLKNV
jgi:Domain of unknown function (DUF4386)